MPAVLGHATYLVLEVAWALPVLALQWVVGRRELWSVRGRLALIVVGVTAYLSLADGAAIANGIWTLNSGRILGLRLGDLPVEEIIFFGVTNAMVAQSVALVKARLEKRRGDVEEAAPA